MNWGDQGPLEVLIRPHHPSRDLQLRPLSRVRGFILVHLAVDALRPWARRVGATRHRQCCKIRTPRAQRPRGAILQVQRACTPRPLRWIGDTDRPGLLGGCAIAWVKKSTRPAAIYVANTCVHPFTFVRDSGLRTLSPGASTVGWVASPESCASFPTRREMTTLGGSLLTGWHTRTKMAR